MLNCDWNGFGYKEAVGSGGKDPSTMIFGRGGAKQTQAPQGSAGGGQQGAPGYASNATPWQTAGGTPLAGSYPTQQAGTGYAGYTPGNTGAGYTPGANTYSAQTGGYTAGGYGTGAQNPVQGGGYTAGGYAAGVQNPAHVFLHDQKLAHFIPIPFVIGVQRVLFRLQVGVLGIQVSHLRQLFYAQGIKGFLGCLVHGDLLFMLGGEFGRPVGFFVLRVDLPRF